VANVIRLRHRRQRRQSVYNIVGSTLMARTKEPKSEDGRAESGMVLWDRMFPLGGDIPLPTSYGVWAAMYTVSFLPKYRAL